MNASKSAEVLRSHRRETPYGKRSASNGDSSLSSNIESFTLVLRTWREFDSSLEDFPLHAFSRR